MAKSKGSPEVAQPSKPDEDYEADNALRDIERAHEHMDNTELMKRVHKKAGRKVKALSSILGKAETPPKLKIRNLDDLRAHANKKKA